LSASALASVRSADPLTGPARAQAYQHCHRTRRSEARWVDNDDFSAVGGKAKGRREPDDPSANGRHVHRSSDRHGGLKSRRAS
jgi:hypothetical protein